MASSDAAPTARPGHLEPSKLGTKEYWDALYSTELSNHAANPQDIGTVWFDDSDAEAKLLDFLDDLPASADIPVDRRGTTFLDLGCGNGSLLFALRDKAWEGRMLGVDYSARSVQLARQIGRRRLEEHDSDAAPGDENADMASAVEFSEWDVLAGPWATVLRNDQAHGWDVVLDKGTFDAICLSEEKDASGRRICEGYKGRVLRLVKPGGLFLVTSCNWTEGELKAWFEGGSEEPGRFVQVGRVKYRSFSFGGVKGQTISSLCFRKDGPRAE